MIPTSSDTPLTVCMAFVRHKIIANYNLWATTTVGVVPAPRENIFFRLWYRTCLFKATLNMFLSFL